MFDFLVHAPANGIQGVSAFPLRETSVVFVGGNNACCAGTACVNVSEGRLFGLLKFATDGAKDCRRRRQIFAIPRQLQTSQSTWLTAAAKLKWKTSE